MKNNLDIHILHDLHKAFLFAIQYIHCIIFFALIKQICKPPFIGIIMPVIWLLMAVIGLASTEDGYNNPVKKNWKSTSAS